MGLVAGSVAIAASPAQADMTIGQVPSTPPIGVCGVVQDFTQPTVTDGTPYVVPPGGGTITSWSTFPNIAAGQMMKFKVFRPLMGLTYTVVGEDGPRPLTGGTLNTFGGLNIPVKAGDLIGVNPEGPTSCLFSAPTEAGWLRGSISPSDPGEGASETFLTTTGPERVDVSAVVSPVVPPVVTHPAPPVPTGPTGERAAALKKCKHKHKKKKRAKCRRKANRLPL